MSDASRYTRTPYRHVGRNGLKLPLISLGLWQHFGEENDYENVKAMVERAFDLGITHFDLANNYGTPGGSAERNLGRVLKDGLGKYRDEIVISTKAGLPMWEGPYGTGGSRKHMLASLDQSLERLGIPYVDIFYSHAYDPDTPLEETMSALSDAVKSGKAIYIGLSNYPKDALEKAIKILKSNGTPPLIYQGHFSMMDRDMEEGGIIELCQREGLGVIPFSIFNQGLLTTKYLEGIPETSRVRDTYNPHVNEGDVTEPLVDTLNTLHKDAKYAGVRSITDAALRYVLSREGISSVLVGVRTMSQLEELHGALEQEIGDDTLESFAKKHFHN